MGEGETSREHLRGVLQPRSGRAGRQSGHCHVDTEDTGAQDLRPPARGGRCNLHLHWPALFPRALGVSEQLNLAQLRSPCSREALETGRSGDGKHSGSARCPQPIPALLGPSPRFALPRWAVPREAPGSKAIPQSCHGPQPGEAAQGICSPPSSVPLPSPRTPRPSTQPYGRLSRGDITATQGCPVRGSSVTR